MAGVKTKKSNLAITFDWILGYLAIWLLAKYMVKWGIPEKSMKNVPQSRWLN